MAVVKAALEASNHKRILIELGVGERAIIGYDRGARETSAQRPDYDLGTIMPPDELEDVAPAHAALTYRDGAFWIETIDEHETGIGLYAITPGHPSRVVDGDDLRFGSAELTFHIEKLDQHARPVTRASVTD
jgi:hypothetical protein